MTEVGAFRRHTENEDAVLPALGSGPYGNTSGSGYYTIDQYKQILQFASDHCIEVIPMICMPGQCNAAILSMKARYNKLEKVDIEKAKEFLLNDLHEKPSTDTLYKHHIMNPIMESTYHFINHIIKHLKINHKSVQSLNVLYIGGYGLFDGKWTDSKLFESFKSSNSVGSDLTSFHEYFLYRLTRLCWNTYGIKLGLHANAALQMPSEEPFHESVLSVDSVIVYSNNAEPEPSTLQRGYKLANAGYKVVQSHASYLFFNHPHEPDSDEIGESLATTYIDDKGIFAFKPDDLYSNQNSNELLYPYGEDFLSYTQLNNPQNIIGMQAYLYTQLLRNKKMIYSQLFPRLLAFAERAWHKAEWEQDTSLLSEQLQKQDWESFANRVGYKEFARLNKMGINYRIPPPGISIKISKVSLCSMYPGFEFMYRQYVGNNYSKWMKCNATNFSIDKKAEYHFVTIDLRERKSRQAKIKKKNKLLSRRPKYAISHRVSTSLIC